MIPVSWLHRQTFVFLVCAVMVVMADFFFYGHPIGWTLAVVVGVAAAVVALRNPLLWKNLGGRIALALMGGILLALVEHPSFLAVLMTVICFGNLVQVARGGWEGTIFGTLLRWVKLLGLLLVRWILDQRVVSRWFRHRPELRPTYLRWGVQWVLPLVLGSVFVLLFIAANPVIERWAGEAWKKIWGAFDWLPELLRPGRMALWLLTAGAVYGVLRYRTRRVKTGKGVVATLNEWVGPVYVPRPVRPIGENGGGHLLVIRCLVVFNLIFAVQSVLDIYYMFGGKALPSGMTYAEYAHRGAYPLVFAALLAGVFVLVTFRWNGAASRSRAARMLVYLWLGQNILLMVSTIWRLWLYVDVYTLTRLRLATIIWLMLVGTGFGCLIWKIVAGKTNAWLWRVNAVNLMATLYLCAFINFSGLIADFNVRHCREMGGNGVPIDTVYLERLGPPALPAIARILSRIEPEKQGELLKIENLLKVELVESLSDWRGWTLRRNRLAHEVQLEKFEIRNSEFKANLKASMIEPLRGEAQTQRRR
ncbi:MAG: DUF4173 domain-containing protein [Phycisphaerales bacterium]|nr:DUF4173 domain-containing protein [Phycisphaerales bacterium]